MQASLVAESKAAPDLEDLAGKAGQGDLSAFEALYRATSGRVFGLCRRLCGDPARAEDLTQEAFLRAWKGLRGYRPGGRFESWLLRVAANVAVSERRWRRRHQDPERSWDDGAAPLRDPSPAGAPVARLDLEAAIRELPRGARTVYVLHEVEGFAHPEIARILGISAGTSKAQLHRARRMLREVLYR